MLGVRKYEKKFINACRTNINEQLKTYNKLLMDIRNPFGVSVKEFEHAFFRNMVILLDAFFVHRLRTIEGKDGNPLNEARVVSSSLLFNNGKLKMDSSIRLKPEKSILKFNPGEDIKITQEGFSLLANAFFRELEKKYL